MHVVFINTVIYSRQNNQADAAANLIISTDSSTMFLPKDCRRKLENLVIASTVSF